VLPLSTVLNNLKGTHDFGFPLLLISSFDPVMKNLSVYLNYLKSRDSAVGVATGYRLDYRAVIVRVLVGSRIFSSLPTLALGFAQPPIERVPGSLFPGVKQPGREADHSRSTSAEIKKMWSYTSTPPYDFMAGKFLSSCTIGGFSRRAQLH
jgi:hypothetical protein